jgi:2EXR family
MAELSKSVDMTYASPSNAIVTGPFEAQKLSRLTLLPKLPPEVRFCIWKLASFLRRDLDVWTRTMGNIELPEIGGTFEPFRFVSSHPAPAILYTSKEARDIGLKHYEALFWNECEFGTFTFSTPDHKYCNPSLDRGCFLGPVNEDAMF